MLLKLLDDLTHLPRNKLWVEDAASVKSSSRRAALEPYAAFYCVAEDTMATPRALGDFSFS